MSGQYIENQVVASLCAVTFIFSAAIAAGDRTPKAVDRELGKLNDDVRRAHELSSQVFDAARRLLAEYFKNPEAKNPESTPKKEPGTKKDQSDKGDMMKRLKDFEKLVKSLCQQCKNPGVGPVDIAKMTMALSDKISSLEKNDAAIKPDVMNSLKEALKALKAASKPGTAASGKTTGNLKFAEQKLEQAALTLAKAMQQVPENWITKLKPKTAQPASNQTGDKWPESYRKAIEAYLTAIGNLQRRR